MADLLIRGKTLPPKGKYLHLRIDADGKISGQINKDAYFCNLTDVEEKAVEVPDHGRLIDADALMDGWMNLREATKYGNKTAEQQAHSYSTMMMYEIADEVEEADTIIPASKEGGE